MNNLIFIIAYIFGKYKTLKFLRYCCDFFYYTHRDLQLADINVYEEYLVKKYTNCKTKMIK